VSAEWRDDGHILVIDGEGNAEVECAGDECRGPYVACHECYGDGTYDPEDGETDGEVDCEACGGTGYDDGERECWLTSYAFDAGESLDDGPDVDWRARPGRYRAVYQTDGFFDDFYVTLRIGAPASSPGVREEDRDEPTVPPVAHTGDEPDGDEEA